MPRWILPVVIGGCVATLLIACYGDGLLRGRQFAYRDSAHFYYPLYQRVQAEWEAGRWPLWEPEENSGMPLLGNPTAAVLYPAKVIYGVLPYPWAARLYIVAHTLLAASAMWILLRSWRTSMTGAAIAALSYAFGLPVLFQYCNIIFLVGAAWLPLGFHAADRWLRLGRRWGLIELAVVLAMQTMGGDPQAAYVLGLCAAGYAIMLAPATSRTRFRPARRWIALGCVLLFAAWIGATLLLAAKLPAFRPPKPPGKPALAFPWMTWVPVGVASAWGILAAIVMARWRRARWRSRLGTMLAGLIVAAALAAALAAVQLLPTLEFTRQSGRAAGQGPHDIFPFSLEPIRLIELVWPNVFGTHFHGNRSWLAIVPPPALHAEVWVPSLYLGGLTIVFALGMLGFRHGPAWRGWLSAVAIVTLLASLGQFTGPLWWARFLPGLVPLIGPHDLHDTTSIRLDGFLRDGDGSFYWFLATVLPGFRQFRFASKLLTFTTLALAALAGLGWDRLAAVAPGRDRRLIRIAASLFALSVCALVVAIGAHEGILGALRKGAKEAQQSPFGPLDTAGAYQQLCQALAQATAVLGIGLALARWGGRAVGLSGAAALLVTTADLALGNARYVLTVPQRMFETTPKVFALIAAAERRDPSPGPYRVHRMPYWEPRAWFYQPSDDRVRDFVAWERDTIQPKYGLRYGVNYTLSLGFAELYDYEWFFGGFRRRVSGEAARALHLASGDEVVVFPRRAFDFWNSRYFVLPALPGGWNNEHRGYAAFLPNTDPIYPSTQEFEGPGGKERQKKWMESEDFQIVRNRDVYPRAWVVHEMRFLKPIAGLERNDRDLPMEEMLFANDYLWHEAGRHVYDPHRVAWVEVDPVDRAELFSFLTGNAPADSETATITHYTPQRVELDVQLDRPGLVVLADIYYPGWRLTIDGKSARIYRTNRLMRGAAVAAGRHRLLYTYEPVSFVLGGGITLAALAGLGGLGVVFRIWPVSPGLAPEAATKP